MIKTAKKIWRDCTTNTLTGEYSLKRLQNVLATVLSVLLTLPYVLELHIYPTLSFNLKEPPVEVLGIWLTVALGMGTLTIAGKYFARKTADDNGNPLEPAPMCQEPEQPKKENENGPDFNRTN